MRNLKVSKCRNVVGRIFFFTNAINVFSHKKVKEKSFCNEFYFFLYLFSFFSIDRNTHTLGTTVVYNTIVIF